MENQTKQCRVAQQGPRGNKISQMNQKGCTWSSYRFSVSRVVLFDRSVSGANSQLLAFGMR
eukprot:2457069-Amphidinium_carterae.1